MSLEGRSGYVRWFAVGDPSRCFVELDPRPVSAPGAAPVVVARIRGQVAQLLPLGARFVDDPPRPVDADHGDHLVVELPDCALVDAPEAEVLAALDAR
ncbi:MAG: hypothetical protein ABMB14_39830 [Myxococcota bacterium]